MHFRTFLTLIPGLSFFLPNAIANDPTAESIASGNPHIIRFDATHPESDTDDSAARDARLVLHACDVQQIRCSPTSPVTCWVTTRLCLNQIANCDPGYVRVTHSPYACIRALDLIADTRLDIQYPQPPRAPVAPSAPAQRPARYRIQTGIYCDAFLQVHPQNMSPMGCQAACNRHANTHPRGGCRGFSYAEWPQADHANQCWLFTNPAAPCHPFQNPFLFWTTGWRILPRSP